MAFGMRRGDGEGFGLSVWRVLIHSLIIGLALSIAEILFAFYVVSVGFTESEVGLLSTVLRFSGMVAAIPIGLLIDRIGSQRAIQIGAFGYAAGWLILLQVPTLPVLALSQFLVGVFYLLATTAVTPLLAQLAPERLRPSVFGFNAFMIMAIGFVGSASGGTLPLLASRVLGVDPQAPDAYRLALSSVVVLGLIAVVPVLGSLAARVARTSTGQPVLHAAENQPTISQMRMYRFGLPSLFMGMGGGAIVPFSALFYRETFDLTDATVGVILSMVALGSGVGALSGARISRMIGLQRSAAWLRAIAGPATFMMAVPFLPVAIVGAVLRGLFISGSWPQNDALIVSNTPHAQRGQTMSITSLLWSGGWALSSLVNGWVIPHYGFLPGIIASGLLFVLSGYLIGTIRLHPPRSDT
jgi:MFS family permease